MSNSRYIEIDSQFRNRIDHPSAANFVVPISISGRKGNLDAVDPVSTSATETIWNSNSFDVQNGGVNLGTLAVLSVSAAPLLLSGTTTNTVIILESPPGTMQRAKDYYSAAVITDLPATMMARIISSTFMGTTTGTRDQMRVVIAGTFTVTMGMSVQILDPTDFSIATNPWIFIPSGKLAPNAYVNTIIHNQTLNQSRPVRDYQSFTHLLNIDTTESVIPTDNSGPINDPAPANRWLRSHTYSIRPKPISSSNLIFLPTLAPAPSTSKSIFNLDPIPANVHSNLVGSFLEMPYEKYPPTPIALVVPAPTTTTMTMDNVPPWSTKVGYYVGCTIHLFGSGGAGGESRVITAYDGNGVVTVSPGFSVAPSIASNPFQITCHQEARRIVKYVDYSATALVVGTTTTTIKFPSSASDVSGFYNGLYIQSSVPSAPIRLITGYQVVRNSITGLVTRTATVSHPFVAVVTTFTITSGIVSPPFTRILFDKSKVNMLPFSYDNLNPFVYSGSLVSQQEMVCYEIELLNLILPNAELAVGEGGQISYYPYVYVELQNTSTSGSHLKNIIYSNNPHATNMLFRAAVDDVPNPSNSSFIKIDGDGARQTIKFKPNDSLRFSVRMQNGDLFKTILPEFLSPSRPNPLAQISAYFSIRRI